MSGPVTVPLSKPVTAHGEEVQELTLRPLDGSKEILEFGLPMLNIISSDGESLGIEIRTKVVARYISKLAAVPMSTVQTLQPQDFNRCAAVVQGFFNGGDSEA